MSYRLLCLDAGFTLLTPRRSLAEALSEALVDDGRTVTEDEMRAVWEEGDRWFWDEYHRPGNDTWTNDARIDEYWRRYHSVILGRLGVEARNEVLERDGRQELDGRRGGISHRSSLRGSFRPA